MTQRDPTHDLIAKVITELGARGINPVQIRAALALNLIHLCHATDPANPEASTESAVSDVRSAAEVMRAARKRASS